MAYIFALIGKSSTGKDTIYNRIIADESMGLRQIVTGTTRPMREGETEGVEYYFFTKEQLAELENNNRIIERRDYNTIHGVWSYFTFVDENVVVDESDYIVISTLEGYLGLVKYYGKDTVIPIYITVDDGERLTRALAREKVQPQPKYAEMCRRFLGDQEDFSDEKLEAAKIETEFENIDLEATVLAVKAYIRQIIDGQH